jgi:hypothetical protein
MWHFFDGYPDEQVPDRSARQVVSRTLGISSIDIPMSGLP